MGKVLEFMNIQDTYNIYRFLFTIVVCTIYCVVILLLQRLKYFNWLKYAY